MPDSRNVIVTVNGNSVYKNHHGYKVRGGKARQDLDDAIKDARKLKPKDNENSSRD